jgi:hypothetical protein
MVEKYFHSSFLNPFKMTKSNLFLTCFLVIFFKSKRIISDRAKIYEKGMKNMKKEMNWKGRKCNKGKREKTSSA